jgi:hypothetical protein
MRKMGRRRGREGGFEIGDWRFGEEGRKRTTDVTDDTDEEMVA